MKIVSAVLFVLLHKVLLAHAFYFGFAEMAYDAEEEHYELTIQLTAHDFEEDLKDKGLLVRNLEDELGNASFLQVLNREVNRGFKITHPENIVFEAVGFEILSTGLIQIYLHSNPIEKQQTLQIEFNLLMNRFMAQQNKLTVYDGGSQYSVAFTPNNFQQTLKLP